MAAIELKLKPFTVPSFVIAATTTEILVPPPSFPLGDLSAETLAAMCDDFRATVFAKAGKKDPTTREQGDNDGR